MLTPFGVKFARLSELLQRSNHYSILLTVWKSYLQITKKNNSLYRGYKYQAGKTIPFVVARSYDVWREKMASNKW